MKWVIGHFYHTGTQLVKKDLQPWYKITWAVVGMIMNMSNETKWDSSEQEVEPLEPTQD